MFTFMFIMFIIISIFVIGGLVADYIIPHIKPLENFMKSLPMFWD